MGQTEPEGKLQAHSERVSAPPDWKMIPWERDLLTEGSGFRDLFGY